MIGGTLVENNETRPAASENVRLTAGETVLVNRLRLARHIVHQQILAERVGCSEVGFAPAHLSYFLDELD